MISIFILFLIAYSLAVFLVPNLWFLVGCSAFNIIFMLIVRPNLKMFARNFLDILPFLIIVFVFNLIFDTVISSLIVVWKIYIVTNFCYVFSVAISPSKMAEGIAGLFCPLKIFKVNTDKIGIMLVVALNFIPIIREKTRSMKKTMRARHVKLTPKNMISMFVFMFSIFFVELFKMSNELERTMYARNYDI